MRLRLIVDGHRPPPHNMALDEALASSPDMREYTLRLYQWWPPTLSIGRSQPISEVNTDVARGLSVEMIRRPTGGRAIYHDPGDYTYSITAPQETPLYTAGVREAAHIVAEIVAKALKRLGLNARARGPVPYKPRGPICLLAEGSGDVLAGDYKVAASAALKTPRRLLVHGVILTRSRPTRWLSLIRHTPQEAVQYQRTIRGIEELGVEADMLSLAQALEQAAEEVLGVEAYSAYYTYNELVLAGELRGKYSSTVWNVRGVLRL
ncbi:MAG: lipoate--protein ligase family protein [Desulfurococcales archaeon]|nr:lipoate--protein ligase family protein [Desulfurococcales archaeon]